MLNYVWYYVEHIIFITCGLAVKHLAVSAYKISIWN